MQKWLAQVLHGGELGAWSSDKQSASNNVHQNCFESQLAQTTGTLVRRGMNHWTPSPCFGPSPSFVCPTQTNPADRYKMTFSRSQRRGCSTVYDTPIHTQVVYKWFCVLFAARRFRVRPPHHSSLQRRGSLKGSDPERGKGSNIDTCDRKRARRREMDADISAYAGRDSDLEAFSHNPSDGSFAPLVTRPRAVPFVRNCGSSRTEQNYRDDDLSSVG